jgi:hypothetical protein
MSLKDLIQSDRELILFDEDELAVRADYQSVTEGKKPQILVIKVEVEGGVADHTHTRNNVRTAEVSVMHDRVAGVMQPCEGDVLTLTEDGTPVRWTLAKNGLLRQSGGVHVLKFTTVQLLKQGQSQGNHS